MLMFNAEQIRMCQKFLWKMNGVFSGNLFAFLQYYQFTTVFDISHKHTHTKKD